jgi:hypothetical protein
MEVKGVNGIKLLLVLHRWHGSTKFISSESQNPEDTNLGRDDSECKWGSNPRSPLTLIKFYQLSVTLATTCSSTAKMKDDKCTLTP